MSGPMQIIGYQNCLKLSKIKYSKFKRKEFEIDIEIQWTIQYNVKCHFDLTLHRNHVACVTFNDKTINFISLYVGWTIFHAILPAKIYGKTTLYHTIKLKVFPFVQRAFCVYVLEKRKYK